MRISDWSSDVCSSDLAGTYAIAAAITGGALELVGARADHLSALIEVLHEAGVEVVETARGFKVARSNGPVRGVDVMTEPYPGFPTDLQAQIMALKIGRAHV